MTTNAAKPTGTTNKLIVPDFAYVSLQKLARSKRLSTPPGLLLDFMFQQSGIYSAAWIPSQDYTEVRTLHIPTPLFQRLQYVQSRLNVDIYNFTLMDIVVANLIISGSLQPPSHGEMIGTVQKQGISPTQRGDILQHYNIQSNEMDWIATSLPHDTTAQR